ncbi:MAG: hypothetical protein WBA97_12320 [Actinophytocola sp.]|uniref:hypothetical protein n=1 Tax=Actinophytocola sp. TaxID=1872138 RepID=UPI003C77CE48
MAEFDVKRVTTLEWAGIGAGLAAFIFSFLTWASLDLEDEFGLGMVVDTTASAWNVGFLGWFSVLLLVAAGVLVFLPHVGVEVPRLAMTWLILSGVAILLILLRLVTLDSYISPGFGLFLGLIAAIVSGVAALLTFRAAPKPVGGATPYAA